MGNANNKKQIPIAALAQADATSVQSRQDDQERVYISTEIKMLNRYMPRIENTAEKMFYYGVDNLLPQEMIRVVGSNGTALRAVRKVGQYIRAKGFADKKAAKFKCAEGWTANAILAVISSQVAMFRGFTLAVFRDAITGKITAVEPIEFELCRKKTDGNIIHNPTLGTNQYNSRKGTTYPAFIGANPSSEELKRRFMKFPGKFEILYVYEMDAFSWKYPMPEWWASEFDIRAGAELQLYDFETIYKGFLPSVLITWIGRLDNVNKDKDGMTQLNRVENTIKKFTGRSRDDRTGVSGRQAIALWNVETKEQVPDVRPFEVKEIISGSIEKRDSLDRAVCRGFSVHPVLLGFSDATLLGNTAAIANASNELNKSVESPKEMITEVFAERLYPDQEIDWTITTFHQIKYIPDNMLNKLTVDEQRELINYSPLDDRATDEAKKRIARMLETMPVDLRNKVLEGVAADDIREVFGIDLTADPSLEIPPTPGNNKKEPRK